MVLFIKMTYTFNVSYTNVYTNTVSYKGMYRVINFMDMTKSKMLLTISEAAKISGYNRDYLSRLALKGKIKAFKPNGGRYLIKQVDLVAFLEGKREGAEQE